MNGLLRAYFLFGLFSFVGCSAVVQFKLFESEPVQDFIAGIAVDMGIDSPVVIDAGAFDGSDSVRMSKLWPTGVIHSFEPVSEVYDHLVDGARCCDNIKTYNMALGDFTGKTELFVSEFKNTPGVASASSSLLTPLEHLKLASHVSFPRTLTVEVMTFDDWAEKFDVDHVDILWLDMQGFELPTMKASPKFMSKVRIICTEIELVEAYKGQSLYGEVRTWIEEQGFELVGVDFDDGDWCGNAIFVKRDI